MSVTRSEAIQVLKHLREIVEGHGMALNEGWEEARNVLIQANFVEGLSNGAMLLDLHLTEATTELSGECLKSLASFCLGDKRAWVVTLSDQTSYLMFRFPSEEDPRSIYLGSRLDRDLRNLSTLRKWKAIDQAAHTELFKKEPG